MFSVSPRDLHGTMDVRQLNPNPELRKPSPNSNQNVAQTHEGTSV